MRIEFCHDKSACSDYIPTMSATEIIKELSRLSQAEQQAVLDKLFELVRRNTREKTVEPDRVEEISAAYHAVDLRNRGINETQAADLRSRLKTFAEDWDLPEAAIYDEDPAR